MKKLMIGVFSGLMLISFSGVGIAKDKEKTEKKVEKKAKKEAQKKK